MSSSANNEAAHCVPSVKKSSQASPLKDISNAEFTSPLPSSKRKRSLLETSTLPSTQNDNEIAYIPGEMEYFWECPNCHLLPLFKRLKNSVVFYGGPSIPPTGKVHPRIASHLKECSMTSKGRNLRSSRPQCLTERDAYEDEVTFSPSESLADCSNDTMTKNFKTPLLPPEFSTQFHKENPFDSSIVNKALNLVTFSLSSSSSDECCLVVPQEDRYKTAVIDILIVSQLSKCYYSTQTDCNKTSRSYDLPDNFPGIQCKYCFPLVNVSSSLMPTSAVPTKIRNGRWFCRSPEQLSNTLSKIQHHLMNCKRCLPEMKQTMFLAKAHEPMERKALEKQYGHKATRSHYCALVFKRLDAKKM